MWSPEKFRLAAANFAPRQDWERLRFYWRVEVKFYFHEDNCRGEEWSDSAYPFCFACSSFACADNRSASALSALILAGSVSTRSACSRNVTAL